jgi:predicted RNA binding protein YcfA (HicA-like mRNA interferase family)
MSHHLPALKPKEVISVLMRAGFVIQRQSGAHWLMRHPTKSIRVTVPNHNRDLKRGTLAAIIKSAGFTIEEFLDLR